MKHAIFDGNGVFRSRLDDIHLINEILEELPGALGLKAIMPPFLLPYYNGVNPEDCGISSFIFVLGGHITLHTFSYREMIFADVLAPNFIEKDFNRFLLTHLPCKENHTYLVQRDTPIKQRIFSYQKGDFGPHLFLCYNFCEKIAGMDSLFEFLDILPQEIQMTPIMRPYVIKTKQDTTILSAMSMIAESHISCHVFKNLNKAYLDIFSCSFFNLREVLQKLQTLLGCNPSSVRFSPRGKGFKKASMSRMLRYTKYSKWAKFSST